jgi:tRNA-dihydrouridine synthase B
MLSPLILKNLTIDPPLFLAPMAGITHSAFRRLVADFGGYGALFTEMLSGPAVLREKLLASPYTKRRACERILFYQLLLNGDEDIPGIVGRLANIRPDALDLNLGCPAPEIKHLGAGVRLFEDLARLEKVLAALRKSWSGALTVKCRLGADPQAWKKPFAERLRLFEHLGLDALFVHPRFFKEKLTRTARWEHFAWIADQTKIPVLANGDIGEAAHVDSPHFANVKGLMVGRMAVAMPWVFRLLAGQKVELDYQEVWERLYGYVLEDFPPEKALGRMKEFTAYFSRNFFFGHLLFRGAQGAASLEVLHERAITFLSSNPRTMAEPSVAGI